MFDLLKSHIRDPPAVVSNSGQVNVVDDDGVTIPAEVAWQIQTVGDAYEYFVTHSPA